MDRPWPRRRHDSVIHWLWCLCYLQSRHTASLVEFPQSLHLWKFCMQKQLLWKCRNWEIDLVDPQSVFSQVQLWSILYKKNKIVLKEVSEYVWTFNINMFYKNLIP
jgi:hypothetical protein